jgi:hypothetical protein
MSDDLSHVEHVYSWLTQRFMRAHSTEPDSDRARLINGAIIALEKEWPEDCARYKARFSAPAPTVHARAEG